MRHVPKKNLIYVSQLTSLGYITTFRGDKWKETKFALMIAYKKKEGTLYLTSKLGFIDETKIDVLEVYRY